MKVGEIISRVNDAVKIRAFINDAAIQIVVNIFIVFFFLCFNVFLLLEASFDNCAGHTTLLFSVLGNEQTQ